VVVDVVDIRSRRWRFPAWIQEYSPLVVLSKMLEKISRNVEFELCYAVVKTADDVSLLRKMEQGMEERACPHDYYYITYLHALQVHDIHVRISYDRSQGHTRKKYRPAAVKRHSAETEASTLLYVVWACHHASEEPSSSRRYIEDHASIGSASSQQ
jgi:hypothetical protein